MFQNKSVFALFAVLLAFRSVNFAASVAYETYKLDCSAQVRCSSEPPLAWAHDGRNCQVFRNSCYLRNHNCERQTNGEAILNDTTAEECFQNCRAGCTKEFMPVCTDYKGTSVTFPNSCLWAQKMCNTKEAYIFQFNGECVAQ